MAPCSQNLWGSLMFHKVLSNRKVQAVCRYSTCPVFTRHVSGAKTMPGCKTSELPSPCSMKSSGKLMFMKIASVSICHSKRSTLSKYRYDADESTAPARTKLTVNTPSRPRLAFLISLSTSNIFCHGISLCRSGRPCDSAKPLYGCCKTARWYP